MNKKISKELIKIARELTAKDLKSIYKKIRVTQDAEFVKDSHIGKDHQIWKEQGVLEGVPVNIYYDIPNEEIEDATDDGFDGSLIDWEEYIDTITIDDGEIDERDQAQFDAEEVKDKYDLEFDSQILRYAKDEKQVTDFTIEDYGIEWPDYFTGVSAMGWDDAVTGVGNDFSEALDDALDQLAQSDYEINDKDINKELKVSNWKNIKSDTVEEFIEDAAKEIGEDLEEYQETLDMYPQYYVAIKYNENK